jgi:hypothetical protein
MIVVKWIHLVCFILMFIRSNWIPKTLTVDIQVLRIFISFVTVPIYIYLIFWILIEQDNDKIEFSKKSTIT